MHRGLLLWVLCLVLTGSLWMGCGGSDDDPTAAVAETPTLASSSEKGGQEMSFEMTSPAFENGEAIPRKYSCDGEDLSPALMWANPPQGTQSFALISDDPDAPVGTWVHWIVYTIGPSVRQLPENASVALPQGALHGKNSWGRLDYGGPCPPSGTHRYFFKLYALDTLLDLKAGADTNQLTQAMQGHILGQTEIMGTYAR